MPVLIQDQPNKNTNGFDKRPGDAGRPKKIYTILREMGFGSEDIKTAMGEVAWYTEKEAQEVFDNKDNPMIVRTIAIQYVKAIKKEDMTKIKELLEYQVEKPKQTIENTGITPVIQVTPEAKDDLDKMKDM